MELVFKCNRQKNFLSVGHGQFNARNVRLWLKADIEGYSGNVRFRGDTVAKLRISDE
jgi:hypothetical protein